jgi:2-oxoglutarate ferredoxin oxidoreductase subunit gamma
MGTQYEIRLSGSGGQGMILAAIILAEAAAREGNFVAQTQSYGPEARGGSCKAEVIISSENIDYPKVAEPNVVLAMSDASYQKYAKSACKDCVLLVDSTNVPDTSQAPPHAVCLPLTEYAQSYLGTTIAANIVALGALNALTGVVNSTHLEEVVLERAPRGTEDLNLKALKLGYSMVASQKK